jgi:rhodanese-related sulfurtransferase
MRIPFPPLSSFVGLLVLAAMVAVPNFYLQERRPQFLAPAVPQGEIAIAEARKLPSALWIDARSFADYNKGHMPGALLLNEDNWDESLPQILQQWKPGVPVIVYCSSVSCQASHEIAKRLMAGNVKPVFVLHGGWEALQKEAP